MNIVRFICPCISLKVINACSTFALTNSIYFRNLEEQHHDTVRGDKKENIVEFEDTRRNYELGATTLITCWTKLNSESLGESDWGIFRDSAKGIAIVSTVECVRDFLIRETEHILDTTLWQFDHREVTYYDELSHPPMFDTMDVPFWKRKRFDSQREYRFAFLAGSIRNIANLIFYTWDAQAYIKKICFGPLMAEDDKHRLVRQAIGTELVKRIEHFDDIYKKS